MPQLQVFNYGMNDLLTITKLMLVVVDMSIVDERNEPCDVCNTEKAKRLPISRRVATRAKKPLDIVHVD